MIDQSLENQSKLRKQGDQVSIEDGGRDSSQFGYSSSHLSYQFLPSNNQVSFAKSNSGSKVIADDEFQGN